MSNFDFDDDAQDNLNNLNLELQEQYKQSVVVKKPYYDLTLFFKEKRMTEGKELKVISKYLLPMFEKLNSESSQLSFTEFIEQLALYNSRYQGSRIYSRLNPLLKLMHEVKDFSEFELNESLANQNSPIYDRYRLKINPSSVSFKAGVTLDNSFNNNLEDKKTKKKQTIKNFKTTNKKLLDTEDYYYSLTYDFINEKQTPYEAFKNVLLEDFDSHDSKIHFVCSNYLARELILSFKKKFKGLINLSNVELSGKFIANTGNAFKRVNLSKSNKTSEVIDKEILLLLE